MIWKKKKDAAAQSAEAAGEMTGAKGRTGAGAFAKKNWKWLVPLVVVAAAGAVFLIGGGNKAASRDVTYAETTPVRQDVSNSLSGTGTLNPANTYTVKSLVDGKILTGGFEEGDKVEEGDVLYTIDSSDASTNLEKASIALQQAQRSYDKTVDRQYVRADVDGTVSSLKVAKGDEVTSGQEVAVIRDSSKMLLNLLFPAADAANFSVGQSADVVLDGTFETLKGTITAVTGTDELSTGNLLVRTVTIRVNNAGGLTTAQAATASVNGVSSIASATFAYQAERTLTALAAGTVTAINVPEGGAVNKDDIVLQISGEDLTEAISLAHDLGHTPFGHAGERALDKLAPGGFKHYMQSLRVVDKLEKDGQGLNLTWEVRNGIVTHTKGIWAATPEGRIVRMADQIAYVNHDIEDAVRAGVLDPATLPKDCTAVLGQTKSARITTMINSILAHSDGDVGVGAEENEAFLALRDFMYATVYVDKTAKAEEQKVDKVIGELYEYYLAHVDQMSNFYVQLAYQDNPERAVTDYISGMSDEFAIRTFEDVFVPRKWHVL